MEEEKEVVEEVVEEKVEEVVEEPKEEVVEEIKPQVAEGKLSEILCADCGSPLPAELVEAGKTICPNCYGYDKQ